MHKLPSKKIIPFVLCLLLLANTLPVLAQEGDPTPVVEGFTETAPPSSDTPAVPEDTATPGATLPTVMVESTLTPTLETSPIIMPTQPLPTQTPTRTTKPPTPAPACAMNGVYRSQLILGYTTTQFPEPSVDYEVMEEYTGGDGVNVRVLQVSDGDFCSALTELQKEADAVFVEPNYALSVLETTPNDPGFLSQYYLNNILAPQGWDFTTGSPAVTIAILDTGVDLTHVDLAAKLVAGYDFVQNDTVPQDMNGHGTHVAGIAAASSNNGVGMTGVAWGAQIMPLRVLDASGNGSFADVAEAIMWATEHGARVINMSLGGSRPSENTLENAINYAVSQGVILVAATGNSGASTVLYPAAFAGVIGVGATDSGNVLAGFSNTGAGVDVVAPGVSIYSASPGSHYSASSGTSMAAPQVAGFAALLFSLQGMQYSNDVVELIESSALELGAAGWDPQYGFGLIQIGPAIESVVLHLPTATPTRKPDPRDEATLTPTRTQTWVYWLPSQPPVNLPTAADQNPRFQTPTPGEVFMLETDPLAGSPTANDLNAKLTQPPAPITAEPGTKNDQGFSLLLIGIFYLLAGMALFVYVRKHYSS